MFKNNNTDYTPVSPKKSPSGSSNQPWVTPKLIRLPVSATKVGTVSTSYEGGTTGSGQIYDNSLS